MKHRIDASQLNELTDEQKQKLREWWKPQRFDIFYDFGGKRRLIVLEGELRGNSRVLYYGERRVDYVIYHIEGDLNTNLLPLLSIGQLIELLESKDECLNITKRTDLEGLGYEIQLRHLKYWHFQTGELCDALLEAVKEILR